LPSTSQPTLRLIDVEIVTVLFAGDGSLVFALTLARFVIVDPCGADTGIW